LLQAEVDADVAFDVATEALLSAEAGLVLAAVLGDQGIDLSEAVRLVAMLSGPLSPFGHLRVQAHSSLTDLLEDTLGAADEPCGPVESLLGLLAVAAPGEAPVTTEFFERFLGGPLFPTGLGHRLGRHAEPGANLAISLATNLVITLVGTSYQLDWTANLAMDFRRRQLANDDPVGLPDLTVEIGSTCRTIHDVARLDASGQRTPRRLPGRPDSGNVIRGHPVPGHDVHQ
jgi:hypothetical protein